MQLGTLAGLALVVALAAPGTARAQEVGAPPLVPDGDQAHGLGGAAMGDNVVAGRMVVKYRSSVDACAHCLLARGQAFATVTGNDSLDRLHAELGVRSADEVFFARHGLRAREATAAFAGRVERVRARFPVRSARAPLGVDAPDLSHIYVLELSSDVDVEAAAERYASSPDVVYATPVRLAHVGYLPNDPYLATSGSWGQGYGDLWGIHRVNAPAAWDVSSGAGTVVAIVDTGVDFSHPDLESREWRNLAEIAGNGVDDDANGYVDDVAGWDFNYGDDDPHDRHGHGTHVAGTAAAAGDDLFGVAGVAYDAEIMALQGLADDGFGYTHLLAEAIVYAADNGADVVNNSWGGFGPNHFVYDAIAYANALGVVVASAAGNDGRLIDDLLWLPSGHPDGLTVGAFEPNEGLASFSNYGPFQSLAAPGVDVLSTRATPNILGSSTNVGSSWLRLSGTSMASPHAAGAAAVLLADQPGLTTREVRWHLELNAVQPSGFEGERHNFLYGYGVLDAGAMFTAPPITTRLRPPAVTSWHAFPEVQPVPGKPARFEMTTLVPQPWTASAFAPLALVAAAGTGDGTLDLVIDATAAAPGQYDGDVELVVGGAVDGGASYPATVHVHSDPRDGGLVTLGTEAWATSVGYTPAIAANPVASLAAWQGIGDEHGLQVAAFDTAGNISGPTPLDRVSIRDILVTTDGHDFLVAWHDIFFDDEGVFYARVNPDGTLLDTVHVEAVKRREDNGCKFYDVIGVGHDGSDYWIGYIDRNRCRFKSQFYVLRVHGDGSFARPERVLKVPSDVLAVFDCKPGSCMFAWLDLRVESVDGVTGKFIRSTYAMALADGEPLEPPQKLVTDLAGFTDLATDGTDFMALGEYRDVCVGGDVCRIDVVAVRIDGTSGAPLGGVIPVSTTPAAEFRFPLAGGITHDGSDYVASYQMQAVDDSPFDDGNYVFANRISSAGIASATEHTGYLVDAGGRASQSRVAATATATVVVFEDGRDDPLEEPYPHPDFTHHLAQRIFAHSPDPAIATVEIGAIGNQSLGEGELVRFRLLASALNAATTVFSAAGLPPGAALDPTTGIFQWRPSGTHTGLYPGVVFAADDGSSNASESIDFSVAEAIATLDGLVRLADGTPVGGVSFDIRGTSDKRRGASTGADGRFRVEGVEAGRRLKLKPSKATRKQYRMEPKRIVAVGAAGDASLPEIVATPR